MVKATFQAETIDQYLMERLSTSDPEVGKWGRVHSVYKNVINFMDLKEEDLVVIANSNVPNLPNIIKLSGSHDFSKFSLERDSPVYYDSLDKQLWTPSGLIIKLNQVNSLVNLNLIIAKSYRKKSLKTVADYLSYIILNHGQEGGFKKVWEVFIDRKPIAMTLHENALLEAIENLDQSYIRHSSEGIFEHAKKLAGLGIGLTPSGDDFLVGWISTLIATGNPIGYLFERREEELLTYLKQRTTTVSFYMLKNTLQGRVNGPLLQLLESLGAPYDEKLLKHATRELIDMGSSSGTDMLTGIVYALMITINEEDQNGI